MEYFIYIAYSRCSKTVKNTKNVKNCCARIVTPPQGLAISRCAPHMLYRLSMATPHCKNWAHNPHEWLTMAVLKMEVFALKTAVFGPQHNKYEANPFRTHFFGISKKFATK